MRWNRIVYSSQAFSAHTLLFSFTILLLLKLHHLASYSWWIVFFPLFVFHAVVVRGRLSLPGLSVSHGHHVALVVFELLLCAFLENTFVKKILSLKIVFLPLLAFELTVLVHNFRMGKTLVSGRGGTTWEPVRHFLVAISMGFFFVGTLFTIRMLSGDISSLGWWKVFIFFGIAECFVFLVCTSSSSMGIRYLSFNSGILGSTEDTSEDRMCDLEHIGGHVMKILIILFQILLCMRLEGKPAAARFIPLPGVFSPILLAQGLGVLFAASNLIGKIIILVRTEADTEVYFTYPARARDSFGFLQRGSRSREEQARVRYNECSGPSTVSDYPPAKVKILPKKDLAEEARRLRAALNEQTKVTKSRKEEQARKNKNVCSGSSGYNTFSRYPPEIAKRSPEKDLTEENKSDCAICYEREIDTMLLPCSHHVLCSICSEKCQKCPICRAIIEKRLPVYGV